MQKKSHNLLFILGNPRSGTSLFRRILDEHSCISIPPESNFLVGLYPKYAEADLTDEKKARLLEDLFQFPKFSDLKIDQYALESQVYDKSMTSFSDIYMAIQRHYANNMGKKSNKTKFIFGEKNRFWRDKAGWISECFPNAIILHLIRDPRDVVVSYLQLKNLQRLDIPYKPELEEDPVAILDEWVRNNDRIKEMQKIHTYYMIRYEELILNTTHTIHNLLEALGLDKDDSIFDYYKKEIFGVTEPISHKPWKVKLAEAPDRDNIRKFEKFLAPTELERIHSLFKEKMADYGY